MYPTLCISILLTKLYFTTGNYLEAEANFLKPKLERNNIVNKGVWVRNKFRENLFEKTSLGNFIFKANSLDADRLLQTNFDTFAENVVEDAPFVSGYVVERARRSTEQSRKRYPRKSLKVKKIKHSIEESTAKSEDNLKPTSVFNEYPYEVAVLNNNKKDTLNLIHERNYIRYNKSTAENASKIDVKESNTDTDAAKESNVSSKRSTPEYETNNNERLDLVEDFNKTDNNKNKNFFEKDDKTWHSVPIADTNVYEVVPKEKNKAVTEKGLIKVISMLTKTFKKIMKQHNEVKRIYDKFTTSNENLVKQVNDINGKFQDFDSKYADMIIFNDRLKAIENKLILEEELLKKKHKELESNIKEFANQQKKFLAQQKQFYAIQKVMLTQNEKIHLKQRTIAKTQSEISHRQNNFARILKKTKQLFTADRNRNQTNKDNNENAVKTVHETTTAPTKNTPSTTESIKLNLFSIPAKTKLSNQDDQIIKEKDNKPIDDLIYKYYFNNTFIDNLMKNKILNNYATNTNSIEIARNVKNKRDELETTILLPIKTDSSNKKSRVRRYVHHFNKNKAVPKVKDAKTLKTNPDFAKDPLKDPFVVMAKSFCIEIGQNNNVQTLNWCIEKALRRLRFMDNKLFPQPVTSMKEQKQVLQMASKNQLTTEKPAVTLLPYAPSTVWLATSLSVNPVSTPLYAVPNQAVFFPDNDELESNLKQYDLTPDTEGNVYYDGSLHFSDIGRIAHDSDGMSDIMPGLMNSNSQIAFDLQSKRRAYVKRLNDDILRKLKSRKL